MAAAAGAPTPTCCTRRKMRNSEQRWGERAGCEQRGERAASDGGRERAGCEQRGGRAASGGGESGWAASGDGDGGGGDAQAEPVGIERRRGRRAATTGDEDCKRAGCDAEYRQISATWRAGIEVFPSCEIRQADGDPTPTYSDGWMTMVPLSTRYRVED
ncbi:hypothetical protein PR202_gb28221 [Eleusine coracana subsp. coracana]|uniref:Uncharacterized protein n=1 Tax=Eleusine coracana subsp. coracana TaxID=191504 RepID=A0AAV5FW83_ELECO|nr:hypothetical protein PR202_gb28221 [Eleusine coracana subsp. coracana]